MQGSADKGESRSSLRWAYLDSGTGRDMEAKMTANRLLEKISDILGYAKDIPFSGLIEYAGRIKRGYDRYEKIRKLNPRQFAELHKKWFLSGRTFDEIVDELEEK